MRTLRPLVALPALLLLMACASPVRYDYDVSQDFSRYKTFDLYAAGKRGKNKGGDDPLLDKRIRTAVAAELQGKGFTREEVADPDFLVACYPIFRTRHYRTTTRVGFGGGGWRRPWGYGVGTSFSQTHSYREGTLIIEIVDTRSNQLVWQGADEGVLTGLDDPERANDAVASAVKDTLAKFPPQRK